MPRLLLCVITWSLSAGIAWSAPPVKLSVRNDSLDDWKVVPIVLSATGPLAVLAAEPVGVVHREGTGFVQRDDLDGDGAIDELVFLVDLPAGQEKRLVLKTIPALEEAQLRGAPRVHTGMYLRGLVGPGWESERVAYRIYWNADTALDIFCKTQPILSLKAYASPELNYHVESKYGLDVLKVGKALGVGGFGVWLDGKVYKISDCLRTHHVRADGPLRAVLDCEFIDWYTGPGDKKPGETGPGIQRRLDLYARLSICAGQSWGQADLRIEPVDKLEIPEIVTGVVKWEETELVQDEQLGLVGRWGRQALGDHEVRKASDLGLGVVVNPPDAIAYGEDEVNSYVRLKCTDGRVGYRYHGSWIKEPGGAKSTAEYRQMLERIARLRPVVTIVE